MQRKKAAVVKKAGGDSRPEIVTERYNITMPVELHERILACAAEEKRTFSNMLAVMAEDWMAAGEDRA